MKLADRLRQPEVLAAVGLLMAALAIRIMDLGARPFHHDESIYAYFSWIYGTKHIYHYVPAYHGPLNYYLEALSFKFFGASDFTARLPAACAGTAIVAVPFAIRRELGQLAAWATAVILAFEPTYTYYSRFEREDIFFACATLALIAAVFRFVAAPSQRGPVLIAVLLCVCFAIKESTYINVGLFGVFLIPWLILGRRREGTWREVPAIKAVTSVGWRPWAIALAVFAFLYVLLFTVLFTHWAGVWDGIYKGPKYWKDQQKVGRGNQPPGYYFALIWGEDWPIVLLAAIGTYAALVRRTALDVFLVYFTVASLAAYAKASEKFAWIMMHPLLPMLVLAGIGVQAIWTSRRTLRIAGSVLTAVGAVYLGYASFALNARHRADPRELLVTTQSAEDVAKVAKRVVAYDRAHVKATGAHATITLDAGSGASFPYAWYFRKLGVGYIDFTTPGYKPNSDVLIATDPGIAAIGPSALGGYVGRPFLFRVFWVVDWKKALHPNAWVPWVVKRKTWNPVGSEEETLYVRRGAPDATMLVPPKR